MFRKLVILTCCIFLVVCTGCTKELTNAENHTESITTVENLDPNISEEIDVTTDILKSKTLNLMQLVLEDIEKNCFDEIIIVIEEKIDQKFGLR